MISGSSYTSFSFCNIFFFLLLSLNKTFDASIQNSCPRRTSVARLFMEEGEHSTEKLKKILVKLNTLLRQETLHTLQDNLVQNQLHIKSCESEIMRRNDAHSQCSAAEAIVISPLTMLDRSRPIESHWTSTMNCHVHSSNETTRDLFALHRFDKTVFGISLHRQVRWLAYSSAGHKNNVKHHTLFLFSRQIEKPAENRPENSRTFLTTDRIYNDPRSSAKNL